VNRYQNRKNHYSVNSTGYLLKILPAILLIAAFTGSLFFGAERIPLSSIFSKTRKPFYSIILWDIRLPRTLLACITGVLLAGAGAVFQLFFRNPLAEPGIMGISSGATLGALVFETLGLGSFFGILSPVSLGAFAGALVAGVIVTVLAGARKGKEETVTLLLCGTVLGMLYSSISSLILLIKSKELHKMYTWMLGSFNGRGTDELRFILLPAFLSFLMLLSCARYLDLLAGGETAAQALGLELGKLRRLILVAGSLAVSAAVCAGGTIGFIGLIAPYIARSLYGSKSRTVIPFSMIWGAVLLVSADTVARFIAAPAELPVGVITTFLGAPFFLVLAFSKNGLFNEKK
jgi:iron complex transport system permease protein